MSTTFKKRSVSELVAMSTEQLFWELAQYGRIEIQSDAPTDPSWRQPDGNPWMVVVWTYESIEDLSDDGALAEDERLRYGGGTVRVALLSAAADIHNVILLNGEFVRESTQGN